MKPGEQSMACEDDFDALTELLRNCLCVPIRVGQGIKPGEQLMARDDDFDDLTELD